MLSILTVMTILTIHRIADFILQTDEQAKGKSTSNQALIEHTFTYSLVWFLLAMIYVIKNLESYNIFDAFLFFFITFVAHTITDYVTSRVNKTLWQKGRVHDFFVSVGFDQLLHFGQLFLTYNWLT